MTHTCSTLATEKSEAGGSLEVSGSRLPRQHSETPSQEKNTYVENHTYNLSTWRLRQEYRKLEAFLGCIASSRAALA
jgi:hypothetical protein